MRLEIAHASLQFSLGPKAHTHDIEKLFNQDFDVITGTEAGPGSNNTVAELIRMSREMNYRLSRSNRYDTWVAFKRALIVPGTWKTGEEFVLDRSSKTTPRPPGRWGDKGIVWGQAELKTIGLVSVGSVHPLTHKGAGEKYKKISDQEFAEANEAWAREHGAGSNIAFLGGDFNLNDKYNDLMHGGPLTSCWDELHKYPKAVHGLIDAVLSYDPDKRVKCVSAKVFSDKEFFLYGDHNLVVTKYDIEELQAA